MLAHDVCRALYERWRPRTPYHLTLPPPPRGGPLLWKHYGKWKHVAGLSAYRGQLILVLYDQLRELRYELSDPDCLPRLEARLMTERILTAESR